MKEFFEKSIDNIVKFGDTDIFPYPFENLVFFDKKKEILELLLKIHADFEGQIANYPPANESALSPVSYNGFRWATQLDPIWNAYFLGVVLSISDEIEAARVPIADNVVFSYRYRWDASSAELFNSHYQWRSFMETSLEAAKNVTHVVTCDISEFYPRLGHHRLENALKQLGTKSDAPSRIMSFLSNYSGTNSFGLPVGGPAARILSELVLNQVDRLLIMNGIKFCRFADDYHLFCDSSQKAYSNLVFLSEKLFRTQGLQLQKAKTRIMSSAEFIATNPLRNDDAEDAVDQPKARSLLRFSLKFDPYSQTAEDDYERLKKELQKFDILGLLKAELAKSRLHVTLAKKIVSAIRYLDSKEKASAVISLLENAELLYPIFPGVMILAKTVFGDLEEPIQQKVIETVRELLQSDSHVIGVELNLLYAIRLLSCLQTPESEELLTAIYKRSTSPLIRRDVILTMARWGCWPWLSDLRANFRTLSPLERRAFIVGSYRLADEGKHWRKHLAAEFYPMEEIVRSWAQEKFAVPGWKVPL